MTTLISKIFAYLISIIYKQTILVLILFLCIGVSIALFNMSFLSLDLIESQALENATLSVRSLKNAHSLYSQKVVENVREIPDLAITHNYSTQKGAIPLPITYTIELGGFSVLGVSGVALVIARLRHINAHLESKVKQRTAELKFLATYDDLTQIANRCHFNDRLEEEWQTMARRNKPLSLVVCDVDHFKLYNDRYGHLAGDNCLIEVAEAIKRAISLPEDFLARYGGEEFVIILPDRSIEEGKEIAELIRQSVLSAKLIHATSPTNNYVTLSLGISSIIPNPQQSSETLIDTADLALYEAKKQGRNCSVIHQIDC